jgi:endoglucanase
MADYSFVRFRYLVCLFIIMIPGCILNLKAEPEVYIRLNQLGFMPDDIKSAVILSSSDIGGKKIQIVNMAGRRVSLSCDIALSKNGYGNFPYSYRIDFSSVKEPGSYCIECGQARSFVFKIGNNIYDSVADSLLQFFRVERCGYTNPYLHKECHISDAGSIIEGKTTINKSIDVTGGWHDAGDYIKFLNTAAYATYMLLFSYEYDPSKFGFDYNKNGVPDILEEAKIGLDWMLRCQYGNGKLITQVQDLRDHDVGWRMPEDDPIGFDRPAFAGSGKNLIGIYSAVMALAARIWKEKLNYPEFAERCLREAEKLYSFRNKVHDVDSSGTGSYLDKYYLGKLALGAVELAITTGRKNYLEDAANYADSAGSDYWWSWGDINSLADYRLSAYYPKYAVYIEKNLESFNKKKNDNIFEKGAELSWGTNVTLLGIALQNILYKKITHNIKFDTLEVAQRDFILGRNPWGVSFISGCGINFARNFHSQIGFLKKKLPGGFSAGPATKKFIDKQKIKYEGGDRYAKFQTDEMYYRDDRQDYVTNEPTLTGNATAIFVYGNYRR